jgi:hypothetical protein
MTRTRWIVVAVLFLLVAAPVGYLGWDRWQERLRATADAADAAEVAAIEVELDRVEKEFTAAVDREVLQWRRVRDAKKRQFPFQPGDSDEENLQRDERIRLATENDPDVKALDAETKRIGDRRHQLSVRRDALRAKHPEWIRR